MRRSAAALAALVLAACTEAAPPVDVPWDQGLLIVHGDPSRRIPLESVHLGTWEGCAGALCLRWAQPNGSAHFSLQLPQQTGTFALSDERVLLSYTLPEYGGAPLPVFPCRGCQGTATVEAHVAERQVQVTVRGTIGSVGSCDQGYCGRSVPADPLLIEIWPCDGGSCAPSLPCDGGIVDPRVPICKNPGYREAPIELQARAALE